MFNLLKEVSKQKGPSLWLCLEEVATDAFLLRQVSNYLITCGQYTQAEPLCRRALAIMEQQKGRESLETAYSLDNLAVLYAKQGKYRQAESLCLRALTIHALRLGEKHPDNCYQPQQSGDVL
jgi:tetratricopeptide (TPR) repeat protein